MKHTPDRPPFSTYRVAVIEGDPNAAEMLHTFFHLMEVDSSPVDPHEDPVATIRRLAPAVAILDLDLPSLPALEIARELLAIDPPIAVILATSGTDLPVVSEDVVVTRKPTEFEELLALMEVVLDRG